MAWKRKSAPKHCQEDISIFLKSVSVKWKTNVRLMCFDFGNDDRRKRREAVPSLHTRFEIRDRWEESESEKLDEVTVGCRRMWGRFDGERSRISPKLVIKNEKVWKWEKDLISVSLMRRHFKYFENKNIQIDLDGVAACSRLTERSEPQIQWNRDTESTH